MRRRSHEAPRGPAGTSHPRPRTDAAPRRPAGTSRPRARGVTLAALVVALLGLALALPAGGPVGGPGALVHAGPSAASAARVSGARAASSPRLDRAVRGLRDDPLYVDPEMRWAMGPTTRRALRATLRSARVPVLVAVLPSLEEDESGGDTRRVLQVLQRGVGRDAVYLTADQRGRLDIASAGVPLDLSIPYGLLAPPYDDRPEQQQEADPAPPGSATVPDRLRRIVAAVATASPGTPNPVIDDLEPVEPLGGRSYSPSAREDVIAAAIVGAVLGLVAAGVALGVRRLYVAATPVTPAAGRASGRGQPATRRSSGVPRDRKRRRRTRTKRWGRGDG